MGQFLNVLGGNSGSSGGVSGSGASTALFTSTASSTLVSSTAETSIVGTGSGTKTTPINYFTVGQTLVIEATGFYSSAAVDTLTVKIKAGSTVIASTGAVAYGALTNKVFTIRALITCRTTGASGTFIVNTLYETAGSALIPQDSPMLNTTTVTLDTTATQVWDLTGQWSANSASDTITGTNYAMYVIGSATGGGGGTPAGSTNDIQINNAGAFGSFTPAAGVTAFLTTPTSANLATAVTNETGSGALVFATSPTLVTPVLGTVAAGSVLTNATGLPLTTGVTGILPVANGGTATATPGIVAGTNVTVTGTWPNQTVNSTAAGSGAWTAGTTGTTNAPGVGGRLFFAAFTNATTTTITLPTTTDGNTFALSLEACNGTATLTFSGNVFRYGDANAASTVYTPNAQGATATNHIIYGECIDSRWTIRDTFIATAVAAVTISASDIDWSKIGPFTKTLAANTTFTFSNTTNGQTISVALTNTASNFTVTWPTVKWTAGTPPVMTIGAKDDVYTFQKIGSTFYGAVVQNMS